MTQVPVPLLLHKPTNGRTRNDTSFFCSADAPLCSEFFLISFFTVGVTYKHLLMVRRLELPGFLAVTGKALALQPHQATTVSFAVRNACH